MRFGSIQHGQPLGFDAACVPRSTKTFCKVKCPDAASLRSGKWLHCADSSRHAEALSAHLASGAPAGRSMQNYLEKFVQDSGSLPDELARSLRQMRELDEEAVRLQAGIDEAVRAKVLTAAQKAKTAAAHRSKRNKAAPRPVAPLKLDDKLADDIKRLMAVAHDKVTLSRRLYDFVDRRISQTDVDIKHFDAELDRERKKLGLPTSKERDQIATAGATANDRKLGKQQRKRKREAAAAAAAAAAAVPPDGADSPAGLAALPVPGGAGLPAFDPEHPDAHIPEATNGEPTYCYCGKVSFGDMIACDNPDCAIEWFHNVCVGIKPGTQPKGAWYCRDCAELKRKGQLA